MNIHLHPCVMHKNHRCTHYMSDDRYCCIKGNMMTFYSDID